MMGGVVSGSPVLQDQPMQQTAHRLMKPAGGRGDAAADEDDALSAAVSTVTTHDHTPSCHAKPRPLRQPGSSPRRKWIHPQQEV